MRNGILLSMHDGQITLMKSEVCFQNAYESKSIPNFKSRIAGNVSVLQMISPVIRLFLQNN